MFLKVSDLSAQNQRPQVAVDADEIGIVEISQKRLGATAVLQGDDTQGIITDGDIRRMLEAGGDFMNLKPKTLCLRILKQIQADELASVALEIMEEHKISQLLVMGRQSYIGIVHLHDILKEGII